MIDWKMVISLTVLVILLTIVITLIAPPVKAADTAAIPYFVQQGDTVYVGETVDISGVVGWSDSEGEYYIVWCSGGFGCAKDQNASYKLHLPGKSRTGTVASQYRFYLDPDIFGNRLGVWEQYGGTYERAGNTVAFVVRPAQSGVHQINQTTNITLQNPNQTPVVLPKVPLLPVRHISDYLIAKGDGFKLLVNGTTNVWIFGAREALYDYHSFKGVVDISPAAMNTLSPGSYKLLIQTRPNGSAADSPVRYNNATGELEWFDTKTFSVMTYRVTDQTPEAVLKKLETIFPTTNDKFMLFNLEVQDPMISIDQIDATNALSDIPQNTGVTLDNPNYIDVRGYTNLAPDTIIKVKVDPDFNVADDHIWDGSIITKTEGDLGGDMRTFKAIIPLKLYNMVPGRHFVAAKPASGKVYVTVDFYIYDNPVGTYVPNKTIRYVSGRYGPDEIVPTPTPVVVERVVTQIVTQTITIPVTPSNEQVYIQQRKAQDEINTENWKKVVVYGSGGVLLVGCMIYGVSVLRRAKQL